MNTARRIGLAAAAAALLLAPAASHAQARPDEALQRNIQGRLDQLLAADRAASPLQASIDGDRASDTRWPDASPEAVDDRLRTWRRLRRDARGWLDERAAALTPQQRTTLELADFVLTLRIDEYRHRPEQTPLTQQTGPFVSYPQLPSRLAFSTEKHYLDYIQRLQTLPAHLKDLEANMRAGLEAGRTPPKIVLRGVAEQARAVAADRFMDDPTAHPMYAPFTPKGVPRHLKIKASVALRDFTIPAWRDFADFVTTEYIPGARESIAAADLPDGEDYYQLQIRRYTTLDLTAGEIHQTGLEEVARLKREMFAIINESGFADVHPGLEGDALFAAFTDFLRTDDRFYHDEPEDLLRHYRDICKRADAELLDFFTRLPRLPYGVRALPDFVAPSAPTAYYYGGSLETGVAGYFMANTYGLDQRPKYEAVALALHEAVPGHHLQTALAKELAAEGLHPWRSTLYFTGFGEGWGLYAERLGLEVGPDHPRGLYADPYDEFGRLSYEMWRAMRLVVDTGIHAKGWSRDRAIRYMKDNSALSETNIISEIDHYITWPAQALGYKLGELVIRDLRARAERELRSAFDLRLFHDHLLAAGSTTLPILERRVEEWIDSRRHLIPDPDDDM